jgi:hypothetical protein
MIKHLVISVVSFFHHQHHVAKPALNMQLLERTSKQLTIFETNKLICVYPISAAMSAEK